MKGLIPSQIGLAERINPQGYTKIAWENFIREQVEKDDLRRWAQRETEQEKMAEMEEDARIGLWETIKKELRALIP